MLTDISFHEDDRAQRLLDVFPHLEGQINVSYVNSTSHVVAWHRHEIQTDYWVCLRGSFKVGLAKPRHSVPLHSQPHEDDYDVEWVYLSDKKFQVLEIVPGIHHGYRAIEPGSVLLYYLTHKYNPDDEWRAKPGDFGETWETINK